MADSPKEGEAAQALFCAIADYLGISTTKKEFDLLKYPTYALFKETHKKVIEDIFSKIDTPQITLSQIETFLTKADGWYESSINIALKLLNEIQRISSKFSKIKSPKLQDIVYVRGAKKEKGRDANAMEHISFLFNVANTNEKNYFGDINKWSPADIYFVSKKATDTILEDVELATTKLKKSYKFSDLNKLTSELVTSGDLLPLSLKKAEKNVNIVNVNFVRSDEEKYLSSLQYFGVSDWSKLYTRAKPITRDIKIYFSANKKEKIKIRHDAYSDNYGVNKAVKCEIEVTGAGGRGGSVVGIPLIARIISTVDSDFAKSLSSAFDKGISDYARQIELTNKKFKIKSGIKLKDPAKSKYDAERATLSALYVANSIMPVVYKWFKKNETDKKNKKLNDKMIQAFNEYTSSRTIKSGKFVIAK